MKRQAFLLAVVFCTVLALATVIRGDSATAAEDAVRAPASREALVCFTDIYEPNESCGAASTPLGAGFYTPLYVCQGESDWYRVDVPAGQALEVTTLFSHAEGDLELQLYDDDCSTVLSYPSSVTDNETVTAAPEQVDKTYYVRSFGWDAGTEAAYELEIRSSCEGCFTYQGTLQDGGAPANGDYEFQFQLFDIPADGTPVTAAITRVLPVADGLVTAQLYFGDPNTFTTVFPLYLEISVRQDGSGDPFSTLSPRQELTAVPFAHTLRPGAIITGSLASNPMLTLGNSGPGGDGLRVESAAADGVVVNAPGSSGVEVFNSGSYGYYVAGAQNDGVYVSSTDDDGVYVGNVDDDGVYISNADGDGVYVATSGRIGVYARTTNNGQPAGYFYNSGATDSPGTGLLARSNTDAAPDIELEGTQGRIAAISVGGSNGSDLFIESNDNVTAQLDRDNNEANSFFGLLNGSGSYPFFVYESGDGTFTGNLTKAGGSFMIDHPLDPENKLLYHSFVESPDMMNVYNGNIELDENGEAWVQLPDYFGALNKDFRYQLTPIGAPGPNLYIAEPVTENRFKIAGGTPGMTVSWQVTGIRQDPYAEANRIVVEVDKDEDQLGTYLHPEAYGFSSELQMPLTEQLPPGATYPEGVSIIPEPVDGENEEE